MALKLHCVMRLCNLIPTKAMFELYKAAILPHMVYTVVLYGISAKAASSQKLERVQEQASRAVYCAQEPYALILMTGGSE